MSDRMRLAGVVALLLIEPALGQKAAVYCNFFAAFALLPLLCAYEGAGGRSRSDTRLRTAVGLGLLFALWPCPSLLPGSRGTGTETWMAYVLSFPLYLAFCCSMGEWLSQRLTIPRFDVALVTAILAVPLWLFAQLLTNVIARYQFLVHPAQIQPMLLWFAEVVVLFLAAEEPREPAQPPMLESLDELLSASMSMSRY
jgi:hypothetical protein